MIIGDVPFANEVEIVGAELNFPEDVSKGKQNVLQPLAKSNVNSKNQFHSLDRIFPP